MAISILALSSCSGTGSSIAGSSTANPVIPTIPNGGGVVTANPFDQLTKNSQYSQIDCTNDQATNNSSKAYLIIESSTDLRVEIDSFMTLNCNSNLISTQITKYRITTIAPDVVDNSYSAIATALRDIELVFYDNNITTGLSQNLFFGYSDWTQTVPKSIACKKADTNSARQPCAGEGYLLRTKILPNDKISVNGRIFE